MIRAETLGTKVFERLLPMILSGELASGSSLREVELATRLGVSRTPIREALRRLAEYGVVEMRANHGALVRQLGREELIYFHQMREALEGMAAELACGRLAAEDFGRLDALAEAASDAKAPGYFEAFDRYDVELHRLVAERSGNPLLAREIAKLHGLTVLIHDQLESFLIRTRQILTDEKFEIRTMCWHQHVNLVAALRAGDPAECRRVMVEHLRATYDFKIRLVPPSDPSVVVPGERQPNGVKRPYEGVSVDLGKMIPV